MRRVQSSGKAKRGTSKARVPRRVPVVRPKKASSESSPRGTSQVLNANKPAFTSVFFEAGYWWPDIDEVPAEECASVVTPDSPDRAARTAALPPSIRGGVSIPVLGLRTISEANAHEHWRTRAARAKHQKNTVALVLRASVAHLMMVAAPLVVTLTRIAPSNGLDSDNMVGSQKHVRDAVADVLGVNDKDPRVEWRVEQRKGPWAVEIQIAAR